MKGIRCLFQIKFTLKKIYKRKQFLKNAIAGEIMVGDYTTIRYDSDVGGYLVFV